MPALEVRVLAAARAGALDALRDVLAAAPDAQKLTAAREAPAGAPPV